MYQLANEQLAVEILDPVADQVRMGVRYCTGGYIFQITDDKHGPLLTGPTYPGSFNWFDGQGIPDAFNLNPLIDPAGTDPRALVLGIGLCDLAARTVDAFCTWDVSQDRNSITFRTTHTFQRYVVALTRTVSLVGRTIRSWTSVDNQGPMPVPLRWFPHPFYPHPAGDDLIKLNLPVASIADEAYALGENGFIARCGWPWQEGHYLPLSYTPDAPLTLLQRHPRLGLVGAICSYVPSYFPIWGNPHTFSWEPFLERTVGMGQSLTWWIDYEF